MGGCAMDIELLRAGSPLLIAFCPAAILFLETCF
jgi:hypothetical protein